MQQFSEYRVFFKGRFMLDKFSIGQARCLSFNINRDALARANSTFTLDSVPNALEIGDVMGVYDRYGTVIYTGVVTMIEELDVECSQIIGLFDDDFLYSLISKSSTIEQTIYNTINNQFKSSSDPLIKDLFSKFDLQHTPTNAIGLPKESKDYVVNFEDLLYRIFNNYNVQLFIDIPFKEKTPTINIKKCTKQKIVLSDNTAYIPLMSSSVEIYETNKLIVYSSEETGYTYRATFYGSINGITENQNEMTRLNKVNTNIVFTDDDFSVVKAQNLRNEMFNHKLEIELMLKNKHYNFWEMELGQQMSVWFKDKQYDTILTGYSLNKEEDSDMDRVKLIFGKVRTKASQRWSIR